jgi:hypothetical protein
MWPYGIIHEAGNYLTLFLMYVLYGQGSLLQHFQGYIPDLVEPAEKEICIIDHGCRRAGSGASCEDNQQKCYEGISVGHGVIPQSISFVIFWSSPLACILKKVNMELIRDVDDGIDKSAQERTHLIIEKIMRW